MATRSLAVLLSRWAQHRPEALFVRYLAGGRELASRSYGETYRNACRWARLLAERSLKPGGAVALCLPNGEDFVGAFFGTLLAGGVPAAVSPPRGPDDQVVLVVAEATRFLSARLAIVPCSAGTTFRAAALQSGLEVVSATELDNGADEVPPPRVAGDTGLLQLTSGTCGQPKVVQLSHAAVLAQVTAVANRLELNDDDSAVSWLPLSHDMGLIGFLLTPAFIGRQVTLMPVEDFVLSPMRWVRALSEYGATITGAPPSAYMAAARFARDREAEQLDLSRVRAALVGAEPIERRAIERFTHRFAASGFDPSAMMPTYGLAESCLAVTMPRPGHGATFEEVDSRALQEGRVVAVANGSGRAIAAVGHPMDDVTVTIVGTTGEELPERRVGEITVAGPSVFSGYLDHTEATAHALRNGRLHTGDLGYLSQGVLHVTGRSKEVLIVGGRNYPPEDVEAVAARSAGVSARRTVAFSIVSAEQSTESIVVLVEVATSATDDHHQLCRRVHQGLIRAGLPVDTVVGVPPKTILRTDTGKKRRVDCRDRYVAGDFGTPARTAAD